MKQLFLNFKDNFYIFGKEFIGLNLLGSDYNRTIIYVHQIGCEGFSNDELYNTLRFYNTKKERDYEFECLYHNKLYIKIEIYISENMKVFGFFKQTKEYTLLNKK